MLLRKVASRIGILYPIVEAITVRIGFKLNSSNGIKVDTFVKNGL